MTAFYKPVPVIGTIAEALKNSGIEPMLYFDPSERIGAFPEIFRQQFPGMEVCCFEKGPADR